MKGYETIGNLITFHNLFNLVTGGLFDLLAKRIQQNNTLLKSFRFHRIGFPIDQKLITYPNLLPLFMHFPFNEIEWAARKGPVSPPEEMRSNFFSSWSSWM